MRPHDVCQPARPAEIAEGPGKFLEAVNSMGRDAPPGRPGGHLGEMSLPLFVNLDQGFDDTIARGH